jgi:DNA-binding CsgD family transcriptional regulator
MKLPAARMTEKGIPHTLNALDLRIVRLVSSGMKNAEIANQLGTSEHMVKNYLRSIYDVLGLWNRTELALWYTVHKGKLGESS